MKQKMLNLTGRNTRMIMSFLLLLLHGALSMEDASAAAPVVTSFDMPSTSSSKTIPILSFTVSGSSIVAYAVSENSATPSLSSTRWRTSKPTSYTSTYTGQTAIYAWAKNSSNEISAAVRQTVTISTTSTSTPTTTLPTITSFSIPTTSSTLLVPVSLSVSGPVSHYMVNETSTKPSLTHYMWTTTKPTSYKVYTYGDRVVYAWVRDAAGNISASARQAIKLTESTTTPTAPTEPTAPTAPAEPISSTTVQAANYYVSPSGSDNNSGSITSPFKSIKKAFSVAQAGQLVYVRGGTYRITEEQTMRDKSGAAGKHIKIWAYPGEKPIITKDPGYTGKYGININRVNYLHLKGLDISGFEQITPTSFFYGIYILNTNNSIFEQLDVHHNGFGLAMGEYSAGNLILNSDAHHNSDSITNTEGMTAYGGSDGFTIRSKDPAAVNTIRGCRSWWNSDDGVDLWDSRGLVILENNWHFWNGYKRGTFEKGGDGNGFKVGPAGKDSSGALIDYGTAVKRILRNNLSFENRAHGFDQNNLRAVAQLENNTAYANGSVGFSFIFFSKPHKLKNNISYLNSYANINGQSTWIHSFNSWQMGSGPSNADFQSVSSSGVTGPRKADGSLPDLKFLRLSDTSKYVNSGTPIGSATIHNTYVPSIPYRGTAPDLGGQELK